MNQKLLSVAKGETPADLVIRNGKVVNVYSGEIYDGGVAICGDTIAAVGVNPTWLLMKVLVF